MARKTSDILVQMDDEQTLQTGLSSLNNPSQTSIYQLFKGVLAQCINYFEQLLDTKKDEIDALVSNAAPNTEAWLQKEILKFQYSATNPQILSLIDYVPQYPTVYTDLQIISRCAVVTDLNKVVKIKVATGTTPTTLSAAQYTALYSYIDSIMAAGITFDLVNLTSDKLYVEGNVYYDGQYIDEIQTNVEQAINTYLAELPFNGSVTIVGIEDAIQSVSGVKDVRLSVVKARQNSTAFASATTVFSLASATNNRKWDTVAGYIVEETTAGQTFADKISYIVD
jgi:hypothetical protein